MLIRPVGHHEPGWDLLLIKAVLRECKITQPLFFLLRIECDIVKRKKKQFWYIMPAYVVFHKLLILSQTQFLIYKRHTISTFPDCFKAAAAAAKSLQLCQTLCDPIDGSPPGSAVPGILQTRTLEWVAISFSNAWKWNVKVKSLSHVWLFVTPWTAAYQAPLSMEF